MISSRTKHESLDSFGSPAPFFSFYVLWLFPFFLCVLGFFFISSVWHYDFFPCCALISSCSVHLYGGVLINIFIFFVISNDGEDLCSPAGRSFRVKKGAILLAAAARRIKTSADDAAADPTPVLPPTITTPSPEPIPAIGTRRQQSLSCSPWRTRWGS